MSIQHWYTCARCRESTQHAIAGNRLLARSDVQHLSPEGVPTISWRCKRHRHYKLRVPSVVWASEQGDLCCMLVCGHQVQWVFWGEWSSTPALIEQGLATQQMRLDQRQRCYACGDLEQENAGQW